MHVDTVVPCVGYDDFLALTLPRNLALLDSVTVLTEPEDTATIALAERLGAELFVTSAWRQDGPMSKAAAINQWISRATTFHPEQWLMVLDADILLMTAMAEEVPHVDPRGLYSVRRRMCATPERYEDYIEGRAKLEDFPVDNAPVANGKAWNVLPTANTAALAGYLHLWCPMRTAGQLRYPASGTAADYDLGFAMSFPEELRNYLSCGEVLHLGPPEVNWSGRKSLRWQLREKPVTHRA